MNLNKKRWKYAGIVLAMSLFFAGDPVWVQAAEQGTSGNEIQVMEAEKLEIHLGTQWAGTLFQLRTDAGLYPGTIPVGEDGVLRTELGGSKSYVLTIATVPGAAEGTTDGTETGMPSIGEPPLMENRASADAAGGQTIAADAGEASGQIRTESGQDTVDLGTENQASEAQEDRAGDTEAENESDKIPRKHLAIFLIGMIAAIGGLIALHFVQKRRQEESYDEEDEDYRDI